MWYRLCHVINSLPNLNCPYFLHAFLWRYCNNKVLLSVVKHGPRERSFLLLLLLLGCFDFIFTQNHLLWRQKYKALGGKTACLDSQRPQVQPQYHCQQHQEWWHTCNRNTGEQGQELPGAPLNWFCTFPHTSDSICVGQFVESLFYSFDVCGFSECYTVLNTANCWGQMVRLTCLFFSEEFFIGHGELLGNQYSLTM